MAFQERTTVKETERPNKIDGAHMEGCCGWTMQVSSYYNVQRERRKGNGKIIRPSVVGCRTSTSKAIKSPRLQMFWCIV